MEGNGAVQADVPQPPPSTPSSSLTDPIIERCLYDADPFKRAGFFRDLGLRDADTRQGVGLRDGMPDILWRRVPAGSFRMGGDPMALNHWPGTLVDLAADYWMSAYPVTVAHYRAFVDDGGYSDRWRTCWTNAGWEWKGGRNQPEGWNDRSLHISNHPVEVTWYAAAAYAQWLEEQRQVGKLALPAEVPAGHVIRLADEAEWEWAARYPDGRFFPWGNDYHSGYANIDETYIYEKAGPLYLGRLTAVGIYPLGRHPELGLYDLSGNVSEWCLTEWDWSNESGYSAKNRREGYLRRVVRSGGWVNDQRFARSATRFEGDPDPDDQYNPDKGFRVVASAPLPSS